MMNDIETCDHCDGTGSSGTPNTANTCSICEGSGLVPAPAVPDDINELVARLRRHAEQATGSAHDAMFEAATLLDAQPAPDAVAEADAFDTFAQWFRKNYPGPDTIIHKPDWHSQRIFRAVKHAMKGSRT